MREARVFVKERTQKYVTERTRSATKQCADYMRFKLALALLVRFVFRTNHHNFAVSLDYFAFIAHRLY